MEIKEGRGEHMKEIEKENREKIINFFNKNPKATKKDCKDATGLSYTTIRKHLKEILI